MRIISHRGTLDGAIRQRENTTAYILEALARGFDVEIDVWLTDGVLRLGHDGPEELLDLESFDRYASRLWVHCKNVAALHYFCDLEYPEYNFFGHSNDSFVVTSQKYVFSIPTREPPMTITSRSVLVMPEHFTFFKGDTEGFAAVLTDYPERWLNDSLSDPVG